MSPFKTALLPVFLSLGLHAAAGWSLGRHWEAGSERADAVIQISYPEERRSVAQAPTQLAQKAPKPALPKRKIPSIPVPRMTAEAGAHKTAQAQPVPVQKIAEVRPAPVAASPVSAPKTKPKSGAEFMADPQKGKIFIGYFSEVKKKIQKTLVDNFSHRYSGRGSVALAFVLNSKGFVEKVNVLKKGTDGDAALHDLAIQCLRASAPFGSFPSSLGSDRIAFNVTIFFDGQA